MRQNIICHIISEQDLSLPPDASRWIIHPASFHVGKSKRFVSPQLISPQISYPTTLACFSAEMDEQHPRADFRKQGSLKPPDLTDRLGMLQSGIASYRTWNFWSLYGIQLQVLVQTELQDFVNQFWLCSAFWPLQQSQTSPVLKNQDTHRR